MPLDQSGCILVARRFFRSWTWKLPHHQRSIALWFIQRARWQREPTTIPTKRGPLTLHRGQLWTTYAEIARECAVSIKQARVAVRQFTTLGFIRAEQRAQFGSVLTICNYDRWQNTNNYRGQNRGQQKGRTGAEPGHSSESGNQGNQEKETPSTYRPGLTPSLQKRRELVIRYGPEKGAEEYRKWVRGKSDKEMFG